MFEFKYKQFEFKWLSVNLYNKFCIGTFTLGSTLIADSFTLNWWNLFVFNVNASNIELAYNQVDDFNSVELVFGLTFIVLSIIFFLLKKKYELWYKTKYPRNLIAIKQQGLQATSFPDFNRKTAGKDFRSFCVHPILVDEIDFDKNKFQAIISGKTYIFDKVIDATGVFITNSYTDSLYCSLKKAGLINEKKGLEVEVNNQFRVLPILENKIKIYAIGPCIHGNVIVDNYFIEASRQAEIVSIELLNL
ncbi:MAG: hypothetical protein JKX79_09390, partial [Labilibaculum sp.]|nr:hypothetical protein [Labilibaculum sp.]